MNIQKNKSVDQDLASKVVETIQDACYVLDKDCRFIYANRKAKAFWQKTDKELYGHKMVEIFPEVEETFPYKNIIQVIKEKKTMHFQNLSPIIDKWIEVHVYPFRGGAIVHFHDFTDKKKLEEKVTEQLALLQLSQDAFIVHDENNKISFWSGGAPSMYGWTEKEAIRKVASHLLKTEFPIPLQEIHTILKRKGTWKGELVHTKKNGDTIVVESTWVLLKNAKDFSVLEVNHDITERKALEERKNEFISMASHELKTPITSLKIFTEVLEKTLDDPKPKQARNFLSKMNGQIDRLTNLVQELLDVSRIEAGKLELKREDFDVKEFLNDIVEYIQPTTEKHQIICNGTAKGMVYGDKDRIGQVVINLLNNAIKYSPQGGKIIVSVKKNSHDIIVSVQDFGIGIPAKHLKEVFNRFYQVASPKDKTYPGLGMGLYISEQIVRRHGGRIWVESIKGKGSTFFFTIPMSRIEVQDFLQQKEIISL